MTGRAKIQRAMPGLLLAFGAVQLATGLLQWLAPGFFFDHIGPFGARNDHYLGDVASFYLALGAVAIVAARRPAWRVPVLAFATIQFLLHSINHLIDIGEADPGYLGPLDFGLLALTTAGLAGLLVISSQAGEP
jgi:hypothetical protein